MSLYAPIKRLGDILVAGAVLVVTSPLLLIAAIVVKLTSSGPVLFTQLRAGRGGRPFRIYKYRTMRGGRAPDPNELVPLDHPEITAIGRVLRRTKIDELPQLLNVLAGHMSLIGPRPTLPDQVEQYDEFQRRRLDVRPGCTGLAQVNGNTALTWPERIEWDVYYVGHVSLTMDMRILLRTIGVIALGEQRFFRRFAESGLTQSQQP